MRAFVRLREWWKVSARLPWAAPDEREFSGVLRLSYAAGYAPTDGAPAAALGAQDYNLKQNQKQIKINSPTLATTARVGHPAAFKLGTRLYCKDRGPSTPLRCAQDDNLKQNQKQWRSALRMTLRNKIKSNQNQQPHPSNYG
jgi:hypothetical protein